MNWLRPGTRKMKNIGTDSVHFFHDEEKLRMSKDQKKIEKVLVDNLQNKTKYMICSVHVWQMLTAKSSEPG